MVVFLFYLMFTRTSAAFENIEFNTSEDDERAIVLFPTSIHMEEVIVGNKADEILTIGTNGSDTIKIDSIEVENSAVTGFEYDDSECKNKVLKGRATCSITMSWLPAEKTTLRNKFKIVWHKFGTSDKKSETDEVEIFGTTESGNNSPLDESKAFSNKGNVKYAFNFAGEIIGIIDEIGNVRDTDGQIIGRVDADGMVIDYDDVMLGIAGTGKLLYNVSGNIIGYVNRENIAYNTDNDIIGKEQTDGLVVNAEGKIIGKAVDYGYVGDDNGNIIGLVQTDGTVIDIVGNIIGKLDLNGKVVDLDGNSIGRIVKAGEIASDDAGKQIGVVLPNGDVADEKGNIVGHMDADGSVIVYKDTEKRGLNSKRVVDEIGNIEGNK